MASKITFYRSRPKKGFGSEGYKPLRRMCRKCEKMYVPDGRFQKLCYECIRENFLLSKEKTKRTLKKKKNIRL